MTIYRQSKITSGPMANFIGTIKKTINSDIN